MTEYLRMSGIYWGLTAMSLMDKLDMMDREGVIQFVKSCQHDNGGFSASINHDPHLLYTLSAVQVNVVTMVHRGVGKTGFKRAGMLIVDRQPKLPHSKYCYDIHV